MRRIGRGLGSKSRSAVVQLGISLLGLTGPSLLAQEDPDSILTSAFVELKGIDAELRKNFKTAHADLAAAIRRHRRAREIYSGTCVGFGASESSRIEADQRLADLEKQNDHLKSRELELNQVRSDLESGRIAIERKTEASGRNQGYRREMWTWISSYRKDYLRPFENEILNGKVIYAEAVRTHAEALEEIAESCGSKQASVIATPLQIATVVTLIQKLQDLLSGS